MQTFLPYNNLFLSATCLDNKRLGKQITEAFQILDVLHLISDTGARITEGSKYRCAIHHPAVLMWIGYESALKLYISVMYDEWRFRGFKYKKDIPLNRGTRDGISSPYWVCKELSNSHQAALCKKMPSHYLKKFGDKNSNICYYWPRVWSPKLSKIINIPVNVYLDIGTKGKLHYDKELAVIKKKGL